MAVTAREIAWLAGLLDGEGCFSNYRSPQVSLVMGDEDVVRRAAILMGAPSVTTAPPGTGGTKIMHRCQVNGRRAIGLMLTVFTEMGRRRRDKIKEIVAEWKARPNVYRKEL